MEPSAATAYYLGTIKDKQGKSSEAIGYYNQAIDLESDSYEKSKFYLGLQQILEKMGCLQKQGSITCNL